MPGDCAEVGEVPVPRLVPVPPVPVHQLITALVPVKPDAVSTVVAEVQIGLDAGTADVSPTFELTDKVTFCVNEVLQEPFVILVICKV